MDREEMIEALRRLSNVGFGYDLSADDKDVLRRAANEMDWLKVLIETYEAMVPPRHPDMLRKRLGEKKAQKEPKDGVEK
jgi:hypothetical protein